ncbi:unnamed protein product [Cylindrotheca closterium]|uniref:Uncharacterized protein n=1 Tax=Cylindrotheca closterium TaxID=2856 RepID=A0AAD2CUH7_9STRA|nr:unnamed protein product [Cylindrotheca closterium]
MHRLRNRAEKEERRIKQLVGIANSVGQVRPNRSYVSGLSAPPSPGGRALAGFHQQQFQGFQDNCSSQTPTIETAELSASLKKPRGLQTKERSETTQKRDNKLQGRWLY